jgi:hypothetical protein
MVTVVKETFLGESEYRLLSPADPDIGNYSYFIISASEWMQYQEHKNAIKTMESMFETSRLATNAIRNFKETP